MLDFDPLKLAILLSFCGLTIAGVFRVFGASERIAISFALVGFFFYSGLAAATVEAPDYLLVSYCIFGAALLLGFSSGALFFASLSERIVCFSMKKIEGYDSSSLWKLFLALFFALHVLKLAFPEFKLWMVFAPPAPDIKSWFLARMEVEPHAFTKAVDYAQILLTPFFYWSLYALRRKIGLVVGVLFLNLYFGYVFDGYLGRGKFVFTLIVLSVFIWSVRPRLRVWLVIVMMSLFPVLLIALQAYSSIRLGLDFRPVALFEAAEYIYLSEFSFLINTGVPLIESGETADLSKYFGWLVSLPIPGFLKSGIDVTLINYEISEIVLNKTVGQAGFYVVLPGLLGESYYIYGSNFYWLHGIFLGVVLSVYTALLGRVKQFIAIYAYVIAVFFYTLNRGGVASSLPLIVNGFLLFFVYVFLPYFFVKAKGRGAG